MTDAIPNPQSFVARQESWVLEEGPNFYKVVRRSNNLVEDLVDPVCIEEALKEAKLARILASVSSRVVAPVRTDGACLVYPQLSGPDMVDTLRRSSTEGDEMPILEAALDVLAELHHSIAISDSGLGQRNYDVEAYSPAGRELQTKGEEFPKTVVIDGFEVRNFRYEEKRQAWMFFDPHSVVIGLPEEDFGRFVVSLLMIRWGRRAFPELWELFDLSRLRESYERRAPRRLNDDLLRLALKEMVEMRKFFSAKTINGMAWHARGPARLYRRAFFARIEKWGAKNGLRL
ncbi:hypothetical protein OAE84_00875 [bacterium]|nr:hypothetical protein [bacterium]